MKSSTETPNRKLTHKFSVIKNSGYLEISSKTKIFVVIDGKENESTKGFSDEYGERYYFETDKLNSEFEIEIYNGEEITVTGDGEIIAEVVPDNCSKLFYRSKFTIIDMSKVNPKIIRHMFEECERLVEFNIDINGVTDISGLFKGCLSLISFPMIDTSSITIMDDAWFECYNLISFPEIDTSNVISMNHTWCDCSNLTSFPKIDTSNVKSLDCTWSDCYSLTSFPEINTSKVESMDYTWFNCYGLTSFPSIDTSSVKSMDRTWAYCDGLESFHGIDTSNTTRLDHT